MERTKGGYIILDLTMLALAEVEETSISNAEVLKQLFSLSDYAMKPYTKLKPIYLRAVSNTGVEVVSLCELDRNGLVLRIKALVLDDIVEVVVDFENKTAKYEVVSEANKILGEIESAESGSIVNALGIDEDGNLVKEGLSDRIIDEVEGAEEGTIDKVLGLDASGGLVKGAVSGGIKLYHHRLRFTINGTIYYINIIETKNVANTSYAGGPPELNKTDFANVVSIFGENGVTVFYAQPSTYGKVANINACTLSNVTVDGQTVLSRNSLSLNGNLSEDVVTEL